MNPNYLHPRSKAIVVTLVFIVAGIIGGYLAQEDMPDSATLIPFLIFYVTLTCNTFPSVKLFSSITPMENMPQRVLDLLLAVSYLSIAWFMGNPTAFFISVLFLFIVAPLKYILLLGRIPHPRLLKKKVTIDLLGTALSALCLAGALVGYPTQSAWFLAVIFVIANIYFLFVNPMYRVID